MTTNYIGKEIPANLYRGIETVGGKLVFNEDRMIFNSHRFNVQTGSTEIMYCDIAVARMRRTLGIIPNGVAVIMKDGTENKFVVNGTKKIIEFINKMVTK